jgi:hypothetical protein
VWTVAYRELRDAQGRAWGEGTHPRSVPHDSVPEGYAKGRITFGCDTEKRRLIPVPDGWSELPAPDLPGPAGDRLAVTTRPGRT